MQHGEKHQHKIICSSKNIKYNYNNNNNNNNNKCTTEENDKKGDPRIVKPSKNAPGGKNSKTPLCYHIRTFPELSVSPHVE
jgi:hypothetical protein